MKATRSLIVIGIAAFICGLAGSLDGPVVGRSPGATDESLGRAIK